MASPPLSPPEIHQKSPIPGADKAIDSDSTTKWFDYTNSALMVQLATPLRVEAPPDRHGPERVVLR